MDHMRLNKRYLHDYVKEDLKNKMVFISGPRQVGKTTFSLSFLDKVSATQGAYLNWDSLEDRQIIKSSVLPAKSPLIIYDEIHKYARWRTLIKGLYDKYHHSTHFIVTGSAKLDYFRKGGDSLFGRYHHYRLHPFSLRELSSQCNKADLNHLLQRGGFPEPLFAATERTIKRWRIERRAKIIYEDLNDLELVKEISMIDLLADALPQKIGSPLSIKSLSEDLQVAHRTVDRWLEMLERMYVSFRISPYGTPKIRSVKKEQKLYLWDWSVCISEGARFENWMACQLLKYCHLQEDAEGDEMELRYLRDTDKREVDFVVLKNKKPLFAVECKLSDTKIASHIPYFMQRTNIPEFYQVHLVDSDTGNEKTTGRSLSAWKFVKELDLP